LGQDGRGSVLEGVKRHSATGIMKEHWNADDYPEMAWKPLPFAPEHIILLHRGLDSRQVQAAKAP
jgi:hypothetical protein